MSASGHGNFIISRMQRTTIAELLSTCKSQSTFLFVFVFIFFINGVSTHQSNPQQQRITQLNMPRSNPANTSPPDAVETADLTSPVLSPMFSQADTLPTHASNYTANTGGRARQSWRRPQSLMANIPDKQSPRRPSNTATNTSPTDPTLVRLVTDPISELPVTPVAPRSFFDSVADSDSEHTPDGDTIISRASSVRVQRPQIVEHHSNARGRSLRINGQHLAPPTKLGPSSSKAQQMLGHPLKSLYDSTPATELAESPFASSS
jgi:hypothetical protein